jgi:DNA polymerase-1
VLLAADYSQIELRLFAHLSEDATLIEAFKSGEDIHAYTARAVFAVPPGEKVPAELRRRAKAVNFGILYGMGSFGLAQSVGFSRAEARDFIAAYFTRFPQIKQYIAGATARARVEGQVTTLFGRRRLLPDLKSPHHALRAAAERVAINAPLQGSAADLIKLAMVRIARRIDEERLPAQLLLQVHDELIFEVDPHALDALREDARNAMENAMTLRVPLVVDFKSGPSWGDMA